MTTVAGGRYSPPSYLQRLFIGERIVIHPTNGRETIPRARAVFTNPQEELLSFVNDGFDMPSRRTPAVAVAVYEKVINKPLSHVFLDFRRPLKEIAFTQAQVVCYARDFKSLLSGDGKHGSFFLLYHRETFLPVYVNKELRVGFDHPLFFRPGKSVFLSKGRSQHRFVVPELEH